MAARLNLEDLPKIKYFVDFVAANPAVLNLPELDFFKKLIEKFGGVVPEGTFQKPDGAKAPFAGDVKSENKFTSASPKDDNEIHQMESEKSEEELDMEGVVESSKIPTEEEIEKSEELGAQAAAAYSEQKFQEAIDLYTQAIETNPSNAFLYAKRGKAFLQLKESNACIRDCNKALEINCDSAAAYKSRGRAHMLLGNWEESVKDLREAWQLDYDEETDDWLREVSPKAKEIEEHRLKEQSKKEEREGEAKDLGPQQTREQQSKQPSGTGSSGGFPGGAGNFFGLSPGDVDLNLLKTLEDPEVLAALRDINKDPANIEKFKSNPKISKIIDTVSKMFPAYLNRFPSDANGAGATSSSSDNANEPKQTPKKPDFVDDGLD